MRTTTAERAFIVGSYLMSELPHRLYYNGHYPSVQLLLPEKQLRAPFESFQSRTAQSEEVSVRIHTLRITAAPNYHQQCVQWEIKLIRE